MLFGDSGLLYSGLSVATACLRLPEREASQVCELSFLSLIFSAKTKKSPAFSCTRDLYFGFLFKNASTKFLVVWSVRYVLCINDEKLPRIPSKALVVVFFLMCEYNLFIGIIRHRKYPNFLI